MFDVVGKVVVVTGAAGEIGRAICVAMAQAGALGVAALDLNQAGAEETAKLITNAGSKAVCLRCDAGREEDIITAVCEAEALFGAPVSCFVANAGITGSLLSSSFDTSSAVVADNASWEASWQINVMQSIYAARLLVPKMLERGDGAFIVTSSGAGLVGFPSGEPATYIATKHAVRTFADSLRVRYQERGVSVHCICPKFVPSGMTAGLTEKSVAQLGGWVSAADVAHELMGCVKSGQYLVFSHKDTLPGVQQYWANVEGQLGKYAKANAASYSRSQAKSQTSKL